MDLLQDSVELKQLGRFFREQRRRQRLSQAAAAEKVGAKQSQISGFENGQPVLAEDKVRRLAAFLEIDLGVLLGPTASTPAITVVGYCSAVECPGNLPYFIQGRPFIKPVFLRTPADATGRCRLCGDAMVVRCVHCEAPIREGLVCGGCGRPYIDPPDEWASGDAQQVQSLCETIRAEKIELTKISPAL